MNCELVFLYRSPAGLVASESQIQGAPLAGAFHHHGATWRALGLGRMERRSALNAEIVPVPASLMLAAAERLATRDA